MRVFIGIRLSSQVKEYLDKVRRTIQTSTYKGVFTRFDNYHITLKYIGEATSDDLDTLENMLDFVASNHQAFHLSIEDLGSFHKKGSYIVWMGVNHGKKELKSVFDSLESLMEDNGFKKEQRKYQPHITIGKKILFSYDKSQIKLPSFDRHILVDKLTLFWSHREKEELIYTPIYEQSLNKE